MKAKELRDIAARLNRIADEMEGIKTDGGTLRVTLPQPDLFSQMGLTTNDTLDQVDDLVASVHNSEPARRTYVRNGKRMVEHLAVTSAERVGKAQGFCARNDIERTIVRITGRSREDVREAVNRVAERMQITCVKSRSYRYYPRSLRGTIVNTACEELERI